MHSSIYRIDEIDISILIRLIHNVRRMVLHGHITHTTNNDFTNNLFSSSFQRMIWNFWKQHLSFVPTKHKTFNGKFVFYLEKKWIINFSTRLKTRNIFHIHRPCRNIKRFWLDINALRYNANIFCCYMYLLFACNCYLLFALLHVFVYIFFIACFCSSRNRWTIAHIEIYQRCLLQSYCQVISSYTQIIL